MEFDYADLVLSSPDPAVDWVDRDAALRRDRELATSSVGARAQHVDGRSLDGGWKMKLAIGLMFCALTFGQSTEPRPTCPPTGCDTSGQGTGPGGGR